MQKIDAAVKAQVITALQHSTVTKLISTTFVERSKEYKLKFKAVDVDVYASAEDAYAKFGNIATAFLQLQQHFLQAQEACKQTKVALRAQCTCANYNNCAHTHLNTHLYLQLQANSNVMLCALHEAQKLVLLNNAYTALQQAKISCNYITVVQDCEVNNNIVVHIAA